MDRKTRQLLEQLKSESAKERYLAVVELGKTRNLETLPHLEKVATLDSNPKIRAVAYQAVKYLNKIKEQQAKAAFAARRAALEAMDDDDEDSSGWGGVSTFIEVEDAKKLTDKEASWSYHDAVKAQRAEEEAQKAAEEKQKRRRRWRYRLFLWLSAAIVVIGLAFVALDKEAKRSEPKSRAQALERLQSWLTNIANTVELYQTALNSPEFLCSDLNSDPLAIPKRPAGLGPDAAHQDNLDEFFAHLERVENTLTGVRQEIERVCNTEPNKTSGKFPIPPDWNPKRQLGGLTAEHLNPAATLLETEQLKLTPTPEPSNDENP